MKIRDRILARLRESPGEYVKSFALAESIYPDHPPANPITVLRVHINILRKAGFKIESVRGARSPGYRLVEP